MKNCLYFLIFSISISLTSCSITQQTVKCDVNKIIEDDIQNFQEGYSLTIPTDWVAYKDIHCNLTFSPQEKKEKLNSNFEWVRVYVYHSTNKNYYKKFKNIDNFVMYAVERINENFQKPSIEMVTLQHQNYGEYRILKYESIFLGNTYVKTEVYFFYNNFGYSIHFDTKINEFEKYLPDFQKMVESFEIKE